MSTSEARERQVLLSGRELTGVVALALPIFLFLGGPIWEHPFDIDDAAYASYLIIPLLAGLLLGRRSAWTPGGFIASVFLASAVKYAVTAVIATLLWAVFEPPRRSNVIVEGAARVDGGPSPAYARHPEPAVVSRPEVESGALEGHVLLASQPVEGAWVIVQGLFRATRAPRHTEPIDISIADERFSPSVIVAERGQPLHFSTHDGTIHTVHGVAAEGRVVFQRPIIPGAEPASVLVPQGHHELDLFCAIHRASPRDTRGLLVVSDHPHFTKTSTDGSFRLELVPAGEPLELVAIRATPEGKLEARSSTEVYRDRATRVTLHLNPRKG